MLFFIFSQIHLSLCLTVYKMEAVILKYLGSQPTVLTDNKKTDTFFFNSICSPPPPRGFKLPLTCEPWRPQTARGLGWRWPHCSYPAPPAEFYLGCSRTLRPCIWPPPDHGRSGSTGSSLWSAPESPPCPQEAHTQTHTHISAINIHTDPHTTPVSITLVLSLNSLDRDTAEYHSCAEGDLVHFHSGKC